MGACHYPPQPHDLPPLVTCSSKANAWPICIILRVRSIVPSDSYAWSMESSSMKGPRYMRSSLKGGAWGPLVIVSSPAMVPGAPLHPQPPQMPALCHGLTCWSRLQPFCLVKSPPLFPRPDPLWWYPCRLSIKTALRTSLVHSAPAIFVLWSEGPDYVHFVVLKPHWGALVTDHCAPGAKPLAMSKTSLFLVSLQTPSVVLSQSRLQTGQMEVKPLPPFSDSADSWRNQCLRTCTPGPIII